MLARATSIPSLSATIVEPSPAAPTIALSTRSALGGDDQLAHALLAGEHPPAPGAAGALGRGLVGQRDRRHAVLARLLDRRLPAEPAARPTTCSSSEAATISSACVPIDPVEPSMTTFFI